MKCINFGLAFTIVACAFLFGGCASTAPAPKYQIPLAKTDLIGKGDSAKAKVTATPGIEILESEKARMAERIENFIAAKQAFQPAHTPARSYIVEVNLTKYDKGNAFARAMLAGLGQIHVDGHVRVLLADTKKVVGEFDLSKTFAWGGMYGAATNMEDIERTFASAVAAAVTGVKDEEKK